MCVNEQLVKISESAKKRWEDPSYKQQLSEKHKSRWTTELKAKQSKRLTGKKRPEHSEFMKSKPIPDNFKCLVRTDEHKMNIAQALKGKPKSDEHKKKLSRPKLRVCRLTDKKEMSVNAYTRWVKLTFRNEV